MILRHYRIFQTSRNDTYRTVYRPVPRFSRRVRYRLALVAYAACLIGMAIVATWGWV